MPDNVARGPGPVGVGVVELRGEPAQCGEVAEPEVALAVGRTQEEVAAPQLRVEYLRDADQVLGSLLIRVLLALLQQFQVHRVVDVADHELGRVGPLQLRDQLQHVALQDHHVRPCGVFGQLRPFRGEHGERRVQWLAARVHADQPDLVLAGQYVGHVPCPDCRACHAHGDRVAGDDQYPAWAAEDLVDAEDPDQQVVGGQIAGQGIGRLDRLAHQREQVRVGTCPGGLFRLSCVGQFAEQFHELVHGQYAGQGGSGDGDFGWFAVFPSGDLELFRVDVAACGCSAYRQCQCGG